MYTVTPLHTLDGAEQLDTPNVGGGIVPKFIVIREFQDYPETIVRDMQNAASKSSVHLLLHGKSVIQLVPFTTKAWGIGASYWKGHTDLNSYAISIGICLPYGDTPPRSVYYCAEETLRHILPVLVDTYRIRDIVSRDQVAVPWMGTHDPCDDFDMAAMRRFAVFDNAGGEGQYVAVMDDLDIYAGPDPRFPVLEQLKRGDAVKVLKFNNGWALIAYDNLRGYVCEGFLMKS